MNRFEKNLKQGEAGEAIIKARLEKQDQLVYAVQQKDRAHLIDFFIMDKGKIVRGVEVKTLQNFGGATKGLKTFMIMARHWNEYRQFCFSSGLPLNIYVIDVLTKTIYYAPFRYLDRIRWIDHRTETYVFPKAHIPPSKQENILIPISWFESDGKLTEQETKILNNGTSF